MENDCDEEWDPLVAPGRSERDPNHNRVEDDAGFEDEDVEVSLGRRIVGGNLARRTMAVTEVVLAMNMFLLAVNQRGQSSCLESFGGSCKL